MHTHSITRYTPLTVRSVQLLVTNRNNREFKPRRATRTSSEVVERQRPTHDCHVGAVGSSRECLEIDFLIIVNREIMNHESRILVT